MVQTNVCERIRGRKISRQSGEGTEEECCKCSSTTTVIVLPSTASGATIAFPVCIIENERSRMKKNYY